MAIGRSWKNNTVCRLLDIILPKGIVDIAF